MPVICLRKWQTKMPCGCGTEVTNVPRSHKVKLFQERKCIMQKILVGLAVESMGSMGSAAEYRE
jgi:hypothetical protein